MFLLRTGPSVITLHSRDPYQCCDRLRAFDGARECSFHEGLNLATDENTLCLVDAQRDTQRVDLSQLTSTFVIAEDIASFLVDFFAGGNGNLCGECRPVLGPAIVLMRSTGDRGTMIDRLQRRYSGTRMDFSSALERGERNHSLLALTELPLSRRVSEADLLQTVLLIPDSGIRVLDSLRSEALIHITENLETHEWYELRINIFDSSERYQLHYRRLLTVLSALDLGMILGERWTEDHALALMSVLAFQVRLFTLAKPSEVKSVLVGLEYDDHGNRLVDMDLYYRNRKVPWASAGEETKSSERRRGLLGFFSGGQKTDKQAEGKRCRKLLIENLPEEAANELLQLEAQLADENS